MLEDLTRRLVPGDRVKVLLLNFAIARCAANLVILDPHQFSTASLTHIAKQLTAQTGQPPEILAMAHADKGHTDCSCQKT